MKTIPSFLLLLFILGVGTLGAAPGHYFVSTAAGSLSSIENPIALKQSLGGSLGLDVIYDDLGNLCLLYTSFATALTERWTSSSLVCQLHTLTRMARRPRHVVPPKNASPVATIAAIT